MTGRRGIGRALAPLWVTAGLVLAGCQSPGGWTGGLTGEEPGKPGNEARALTLKGVAAMREDRLADASRLLNSSPAAVSAKR